ncbi:hypothetical protein NLG97_g10300 [Lecanicillium saksenae]|uniref:Uncharacterized protein n=1 Tax=Lecanicillium saksenae TaxID=468837 RepID=A0ACC1QFK5_9HYPO|nr:hypothetical protein NLG97_g10300 [Lecanicillium saksenae]
MDALTNPAAGCTHFAPILFDHHEPYCILSANHTRMEHCCAQVAGSQAAVIQGCYPWCSVTPKSSANSSADTSPPPTGDTIDRFYQCLISGEGGALPEGMSCSTKTQRRDDDNAGSSTLGRSGLKGKLLASLGATMMVALVYG